MHRRPVEFNIVKKFSMMDEYMSWVFKFGRLCNDELCWLTETVYP
jgi:hypothetical protein